MYPVDPKMLIQMIKSGNNPQQLMLSILQGQAGSPLGNNLLNLVQSGRFDEMEKVVRNIYSQQGGKDFDRDFQVFMKEWGFN